MYVNIDLERCCFIHKTFDLATICALAFIEARGFPIYTTPSIDGDWFLACLTTKELQKLYLSTTGEVTYFEGPYIRAILYDLVDRLPVTDCNAQELESQANLIPEESEGRFVYARGKFLPCSQENFVPSALTVAKNENEALVAGTGAPRYQNRHKVATASAPQRRRKPTAPYPAVKGGRPLKRATGAPKKAGIKDLVWATADTMWQNEGSPFDVRKLRKHIMDVLEEEHQIKRTTSSNELGAWQRARIQNNACNL